MGWRCNDDKPQCTHGISLCSYLSNTLDILSKHSVFGLLNKLMGWQCKKNSVSSNIISGMMYNYSHSICTAKITFSHSFYASKKLVEQLFTPHKLYIFISRLCLFWWSTWLFSRVCVSLDYGREVPLLRCHECSRVQIERNNCCEYQSAVCSAVDRNKIHLSVYIIILTVNNWNKRVKILHLI